MNRVELEEVSGRLGATLHLVDVDELDPLGLPSSPQRQPSHATEPVDADADAHLQLLS
jgi:hypothetical protein